MAYPSPPELSGASNRIDSSETIESPFSSNLVTPTDEDPYYNKGIHQRLTIAEAVGTYFDSTGHNESVKASTAIDAEHISKELVDDNEGLKIDEEANKVDSEAEINEAHSLGSLNSLSSPPSAFSSTDSFRRTRSGSIYNLPNDHIFIDAPSAHPNMQMKQDDKDTFGMDSSYRLKYEYELEFYSLNALTDAISESFWDFLVLGLRILFFLPWCVAVGGALIFFPDYLDTLAFDTGYLERVTAIRRFSHWATYGFQHVVAFFASLSALLWTYPNVGFAVVGVLLGQFYLVWHDFLFSPTVPLGKDVRHTTYLLFTTSWLDSDHLVNIKKANDAYYWTDRNISDESDVDSD